MFYHWWRYFKGLHSSARRGPDGAVDGRSHYLIARAPNTQFFHYFGLLSDNCWRRSDRDVPKNTCFCASEAEAGRDVSGAAGAPSGRDKSADRRTMAFLVEKLGLAARPGAGKRPPVRDVPTALQTSRARSHRRRFG